MDDIVQQEANLDPDQLIQSIRVDVQENQQYWKNTLIYYYQEQFINTMDECIKKLNGNSLISATIQQIIEFMLVMIENKYLNVYVINTLIIDPNNNPDSLFNNYYVHKEDFIRKWMRVSNFLLSKILMGDIKNTTIINGSYMILGLLINVDVQNLTLK